MKKLKDIQSIQGYKFIDLGCGDGSSTTNLEKLLDGKGLGIELDKEKTQRAQELSRDVVQGNALRLHKIKDRVDIVTCDNFLEHLPSTDDVANVLKQAINTANKFIYIRHPSFEDIDFLAGHDLKTYWSDWTGHTAMLTINEIVEIFNNLGVYHLQIVPVYKIDDSDDDALIPLSAPSDQHSYERKKHGEKPDTINFRRNIYYAFDIVAALPGYEKEMPILNYHDRAQLKKRPKFIFKPKEKIFRQNKIIKELQGSKAIRYSEKLRNLKKRFFN